MPRASATAARKRSVSSTLSTQKVGRDQRHLGVAVAEDECRRRQVALDRLDRRPEQPQPALAGAEQRVDRPARGAGSSVVPISPPRRTGGAPPLRRPSEGERIRERTPHIDADVVHCPVHRPKQTTSAGGTLRGTRRAPIRGHLALSVRIPRARAGGPRRGTPGQLGGRERPSREGRRSAAPPAGHRRARKER